MAVAAAIPAASEEESQYLARGISPGGGTTSLVALTKVTDVTAASGVPSTVEFTYGGKPFFLNADAAAYGTDESQLTNIAATIYHYGIKKTYARRIG
ncbi:MAG: hypothetical protein AB1626_03615 [Candidatus Micrarchaeota archaeon]